jgi:hypothetical protein
MMKKRKRRHATGKYINVVSRLSGIVFSERCLSSRRASCSGDSFNPFVVHLRFRRSCAEILEKGDIVVYRPVTRGEIADALVHIRDLYRQIKPADEYESRAYERREAGIKDILSNLPRIKEHPTLNMVEEVADISRLTIDGAHRLFGYNLAKIREYDLLLNGGRTHIVESYSFERDRLIDLPMEFASKEIFEFDGMLGDIVTNWQTGIPIRVLEEADWLRPDTFFVHIGTEDSLGSSLPPGSLALVEPITEDEKLHPNPRMIYLLQFGNGYRCSRCVVSHGKLQLLSAERTYLGQQNFDYPGAVRVVARVRMFALKLPLPEYPSRYSLPPCGNCADLILPMEQLTRNSLFATGHKRFKRTKDEEQLVREAFREVLGSSPSRRTERRYRNITSSEPHVDSLIYFTVTNFARYTDALRSGGSVVTDKGRFSLETLLNARQWIDVLAATPEVHLPQPGKGWEMYQRELVEWVPLLSLKFPELHLWNEQALRLADGSAIHGLDPAIGPGSWMFLEKASAIPDIQNEQKKSGWSRPLYVFRRGLKTICGYLERDGAGYALLSSAYGYGSTVTFGKDELNGLWRVGCVLVAV